MKTLGVMVAALAAAFAAEAGQHVRTIEGSAGTSPRLSDCF